MFGAALDATDGRAWPRRSGLPVPAPGYWNTQRRALDLGARVLAIHDEMPVRTRERVADALDIPALVLHDAARAWASAGGYRARGGAIVSVLARLPVRRGLVDGLLAAGAIGGLWGRPSRWDPGGFAPRRLGVPAPGTGSGAARS